MDIRFEKREHLQEKPDQKKPWIRKTLYRLYVCHGLG